MCKGVRTAVGREEVLQAWLSPSFIRSELSWFGYTMTLCTAEKTKTLLTITVTSTACKTHPGLRNVKTARKVCFFGR